MKKVIVAFGDSWTYGSELDLPRETPWIHYLSSIMDTEYVNLGTPGSSIGHTIVKLFDFIDTAEFNDYKKIFMVGLTGSARYLSYSNAQQEFVTIHPDCVYRTSFNKNGAPPDVLDHLVPLHNQIYKFVDSNYYREFLTKQTLFTFKHYCKNNNIDLIFFSYNDYLNPGIDVNLFPCSLTLEMTGQEYSLPEIRNNKYFEGKLFHPNQSGHKRIAEILKEFYDQKYPGN